MSYQELPKYDLAEIERNARQLRAEHLSHLFKSLKAKVYSMVARPAKVANASA